MPSSITLPEDYMVNEHPEPARYLSDLLAFMTSPMAHSLIVHHPNRTAALSHSGEIPAIWNDWWESTWIDDQDIDSLVKALVMNELPQDV